MADYYTLKHIATRMGVTIRTLVMNYHRRRGFLMYVRAYRRPTGCYRNTWYTNDALIQAWETAQARVAWTHRWNREGRRAGDRATYEIPRPELERERQSA